MKSEVFNIENINCNKIVFVSKESLTLEFQKQLESIEFRYDRVKLIQEYNNSKTLIAKNKRICRFCGKSSPDVSFKNEAHIIPQLLGNKKFLSDFECDTCNSTFSKYENDLANFLGPYRTFSSMEGRNGVPAFKDIKNQIRISKENKNIDIIGNISTEQVNYNPDKKETIITCHGNSFVPLNVFKCLLKIGLSFVDNEDIPNIKETFSLLTELNSKVNNQTKFIFQVHQYFIPGNIQNNVYVYIYRKKKFLTTYPAPSLVFIFHIRNLIIQLYVPFHENDKFMNDVNTKKDLLIFPPLISKEWIEKFGEPFSQMYDLSSNNKIKGVEWNMAIRDREIPDEEYPQIPYFSVTLNPI